jgi:hypothetical protein
MCSGGHREIFHSMPFLEAAGITLTVSWIGGRFPLVAIAKHSKEAADRIEGVKKIVI